MHNMRVKTVCARRTTSNLEDMPAASDMADDGVAFRPMVWSVEGRPHPVVLRVLGYAAEIAARRNLGLDRRDYARR